MLLKVANVGGLRDARGQESTEAQLSRRMAIVTSTERRCCVRLRAGPGFTRAPPPVGLH